MYEKLSPKLEQVIHCANDIAREYGHDFVGTEHLLLAIFREGTGIAVGLMSARGADEARVKSVVERLIKDRRRDATVVGRLPVSPHFQDAISVAIEEARVYKSKTVCTEHLLLALVREKGSVACAALEELRITPDDVSASIPDEPG